MSLSQADRVWNRAAMQAGGTSPREGDKALTALLLFHGLAMNGGVHHALECLGASELEAAKHGFEHYGLVDVAAFLACTDAPPLVEWTDVSEAAANESYMRMVPDDDYLARRFEAAFNEHPDEYSPLLDDDGLV